MSFQALPNPDNIPGKVSTGYKRQNTNLLAIQTGLDTTEPCDNNEGLITIPAGGLIELNGIMFKHVDKLELQKPDKGTAYWVAIADNGNGTANAELVMRPGKWDNAKKGCYLKDGRRTLNWVSLGELADMPVEGAEYISPREKGRYIIQLRAGWKFAKLASGLGQGDGQAGGDANGNSAGSGGQGGVPAVRKFADVIFFHNKGAVKIKVGADGTAGGNGGSGSRAGENFVTTLRFAGSGGGGGAGGSGEATVITGQEGVIEETGISRAGFPGAGGGNFGNNQVSSLGIAGGHGGGAEQNGSSGSSRSNFSGASGFFSSTAAASNGHNALAPTNTHGAGGGGGAGGENGENRPDGSPGGYCDIYAIED